MRSALRATVGLVLLFAAVLKGHQLVISPVAETSILSSRWFLIATAEFELLLGLWLISGLYFHQSRKIGIATFLVFSGLSLAESVSGQASCGCFGTVQLSPWYALIIDITLLTVLYAIPPLQSRVAANFPHNLGSVAITCGLLTVLALPAAVLMVGSSGASITPDGDIVGDGSVILLEPESWVSQTFPLLRHLDVGDQIRYGSWIVMLHRHDCSVCQETLPRYLQLVYLLGGQERAPRAAILELPPHQGRQELAHGSPVLRGRLDDSRAWRAKVPVFLHLSDGQVVSVERDYDTFLRHLFEIHSILSLSPLSDLERGLSSQPSPFPDYGKVRRTRYLTQIACGPLSLVAVLRGLGLALTEDEIDQIIGSAGSHGTDLLQLKHLAEQRRLCAVGVSVSPRELAKIRVPAIINVHGYGFAAIIGFTPDGLQVVYPFKQPIIVPIDQLETIFGQSVRALLVSREPLPLVDGLGFKPASPVQRGSSGPRLRFEKTMISIGRIHHKKWQASSIVHNDGDRELTIREAKTSCCGVTVSLDNLVVPPRESTILHVAGEASSVGGFWCYVQISTNQEQAPDATLPLHGYLEYAVAADIPVASIEGIPAGHAASTQVSLHLAEGYDARQVHVAIPSNAPLDARVESIGKSQATLRLAWRGKVEAGWYRYRLELQVRDKDETVSSPLHVVIQVVPAIDVFPSSLFICDSELGQPWSRRIRCSFHLPTDPQFVSCPLDSTLKRLIHVDSIAVDDRTTILTIRPAAGPDSGQLVGRQLNLELRSNGGMVAKVPVYVGSEALAVESRLLIDGNQR